MDNACVDETDLIGKQLKKIVENEGSQRGGGRKKRYFDSRGCEEAPPLTPPPSPESHTATSAGIIHTESDVRRKEAVPTA